MNRDRKDQQALKEYLLGHLAEQRQEQLEERLMTDSDYFQELLLMEDELLDAYVRDGLSGQDKDRFEEHFLSSSERRQKLDFANVLKEYIDSAFPPERSEPKRAEASFWQRLAASLRVPSPVLGTAMAAALLIALSGIVWLIEGNRQLNHQLGDTLTELSQSRGSRQELARQLALEESRTEDISDDLRQEQEQRLSLERELASLRARPSGSATVVESSGESVASFLLAPGLFRGLGDTERVIISSRLSLVQLQLDLGVDDYDSYRAALHDVDGDEIWTQSKLEAETSGDRTVVALTLPSQLLRHGDYSLRLSGLTPGGDFELVARYYFRVIVE